MVRPCKVRRIRFRSKVFYFKPQGVPLRILNETEIEKDELEAIRLCDLEDLDQIEAAKKMKISQSTLGRILSSARKKVSKAIVRGEAIRISMK